MGRKNFYKKLTYGSRGHNLEEKVCAQDIRRARKKIDQNKTFDRKVKQVQVWWDYYFFN